MRKGFSPIYTINHQTNAIMNKESKYFRSLILEGKQKRHAIHKLKEIIDYNCIHYGATSEGRKTVVKNILGSSSKLPIPISPEKGLYMIPTVSLKNKDCVLIAYHQVKFYEQRDDKTYIAFKDGTGLYVNVSESAFNMQYKRTGQVIVHLNWQVIFKKEKLYT